MPRWSRRCCGALVEMQDYEHARLQRQLAFGRPAS